MAPRPGSSLLFVFPLSLAILCAAPSRAEAAVIPLTATEFAGTSLITFDGVARDTPVNGMTIDGVLFNYLLNDLPSNELTVRLGPPITPNVSPLHLTAGTDANAVLRLTFATPTERLGYGFGLNIGAFFGTLTIPNATTATLFDATNAIVGVLSADAIAVPRRDADGFLGLRSTIPFVRADIAFSTVASTFVFDNLRFAPAAATVPEPASLALLLVGLAGVARRLRSHS